MPYCPSCRTEYRAGFDTCADCHIPLVESLPPMPAPEPPPPPVDYGEPALLTTTDTELAADMLLAMLADNGIPAYKQFAGALSSLRIAYGVTSAEAKIYVQQALLAQAQELVNAFFSASYADDEDIADTDDTDEQ